MFTPPSTIINRCKDRLIPPKAKGGMDGSAVLLFSRVKSDKGLEFQLEIISTPKNHSERKMTFKTSVVHRGKTISSLKKPLAALIDSIDRVKELNISVIEFNYFRLFTDPLNEREIQRIIALDNRLCDHFASNHREALLSDVA